MAKSSAGSAKKTTSKKKIVAKLRARLEGYLSRRPHRSFRRTLRRDYVRSLKLPGYWAFTAFVFRTLWKNKRLFIPLVIVYAVLTAALVGIASQDTYLQLTDIIDETSANFLGGALGEVGKAGLLLTTGILGLFNQTPTDVQKVFAALLGLFVWLATVWLLRAILSGRKPTLRDALYTSGGPIIPTILIGFVIVLQMLPIAIAAIAFGAATATGLLAGGVQAMLFWITAGLLGLLSLYWVTSSAIALVVVTLPGMYPMQALRTAGDLVIGRRIRIILRMLWSTLIVAVLWAIVMIPSIMIDSAIKNTWAAIEWMPTIPVLLLIMSSLTIVWAAAYTYLLYRRIVDDDAAPA